MTKLSSIASVWGFPIDSKGMKFLSLPSGVIGGRVAGAAAPYPEFEEIKADNFFQKKLWASFIKKLRLSELSETAKIAPVYQRCRGKVLITKDMK